MKKKSKPAGPGEPTIWPWQETKKSKKKENKAWQEKKKSRKSKEKEKKVKRVNQMERRKK